MPVTELGNFRGECKQTAGKLVAVAVELEEYQESGEKHTRIRHCQIDGDFFVESSSDQNDIIDAIGQHIVHLSFPVQLKQLEEEFNAIIERDDTSRLIGVTGETIAIALGRALAQGPKQEKLVKKLHTPGDKSPKIVKDTKLTQIEDISSDSYREFIKRWNDLPLQVIVDKPRKPAEQAAVDVALAQAVLEGSQQPSLRIWQWSSPAVVIGRFQSLKNEVDTDRAQAMGFDIVRRVTGGGAMFARPEDVITYSLYVPASFYHGLDTRLTYRLCDLWLVKGLSDLGIEIGWSGFNDLASKRGKIGGAAERKIVGHSAQGGAMLHHVMLSYNFDAQQMSEVLKTSDEKMRDKAVRSAKARVDPLSRQTSLSRLQLIDALIAHLLKFAPRARMASVNKKVEEEGKVLCSERFTNPQWTANVL